MGWLWWPISGDILDFFLNSWIGMRYFLYEGFGFDLKKCYNMKNLVAPLVWVDLGITFDGLDNHGCFLKIPTNTGIVILHETSVSNFTIFEIQSFSRDKLVKNLIEIVFLSAFMRFTPSLSVRSLQGVCYRILSFLKVTMIWVLSFFKNLLCFESCHLRRLQSFFKSLWTWDIGIFKIRIRTLSNHASP